MTLGVEVYVRYMDDFVILSPDKEQLRSWLARIEQFLRDELRLELNPKTTILAAKNGIDFVGYKHRATHRKVRKDSIKRIKQTIKKCESGKDHKRAVTKEYTELDGTRRTRRQLQLTKENRNAGRGSHRKGCLSGRMQERVHE